MRPNKRHIVGTAILVAGAGALAFGALRGPASDRVPAGGPARRIVSLIPAATEILFALGAGDRLVGRTRWDTYPPEASRVTDVGDGMRPSLEVVLAREPDLVIVYDGPGNAGVVERLAALGVHALPLRHDTLADLERSIRALGRVAECEAGAERLVAHIRLGLARVGRAASGRPRVRIYYDVWPDPPTTIGRASYLDSLLRLAGADNIFGDLAPSAPRVSLEAIVYRDPDRVLVPVPAQADRSERHPAGRPGWPRVTAVRDDRVSFLDEDLVHRLGPRVVEAAWHIATAVHPRLEPPPPPPFVPRCDG